MAWRLSDQEVNAVIALPAERRYEYFVKRVSDQEEVWGLWEEAGWVLAGDEEGELLPVWPHARFAELCIPGHQHWTRSHPRMIELGRWLDRWLPGMIRDSRRVAVFPTPDRTGAIVAPDRLREDLSREIAKYESDL